jgi:hypothetical protein
VKARRNSFFQRGGDGFSDGAASNWTYPRSASQASA